MPDRPCFLSLLSCPSTVSGALGTLLLAVASAALCPSCFAQTLEDLNDVRSLKTDSEAPSAEGRWVPSFRMLRGDVTRIATAPFRLSERNALHVASAVGLTATLIATADEPVYRGVQRVNRFSETTETIAAPGDAYDRLGITKAAGLTAGAFAVGGTVLRNRKMTRTSVRLAEALVLSRLATGAAKTLIGRSRPQTGEGAQDAHPFVSDADHNSLSFPSGHTSQAFALATVIARTYDTPYVQVPAYGFAVSQAVQRIDSGKHWLSDVVVGAALGTFIGRVVTRTEVENDPGISYRPIVSTRRFGFSVHF